MASSIPVPQPPDPDPFFTKEINAEFLGKITTLPHGHHIFTMQEFLDIMLKRTTAITRYAADNPNFQNERKLTRSQMEVLLSANLCRGKIGVNYGIDAVTEALDNPYYDIVVITNNDIKISDIVPLLSQDSQDSPGSPIPDSEVDHLASQMQESPRGVGDSATDDDDDDDDDDDVDDDDDDD